MKNKTSKLVNMLLGSYVAYIANPKWFADVSTKNIDRRFLEDRLSNNDFEPIAGIGLGNVHNYLMVYSPEMLIERMAYSAVLASGYLRNSSKMASNTLLGLGLVGAGYTDLMANKSLDEMIYSAGVAAASYGAGYLVDKAMASAGKLYESLKSKKIDYKI